MAYLQKIITCGAMLRMGLLRWSHTTAIPLVFSKEVSLAKVEGQPIVALESTIITHGMPYPQNLETVLEVESIIRQRGAAPATVAILKGQLTVGLTNEQLQCLAQNREVVKASRRDLASIVANQLDGATTVAGTLVATELAGIPVFVTGGIGGVHREGQSTMDVSADLNELGRSKTLVVCSGVKSILDIERTLEYLETQGVCVCTFGESDDFPAFYTRRSGHKSPYRSPNAQHAARLLHASLSLRLTSGIVIAVPVPQEHAMDETIIEDAIKEALKEARQKGIHGKEVTPFILASVARATGGLSLATNIALIKNNAKVGADIAVEYNKLKHSGIAEGKSNIESPNDAGKNFKNFHRKFHTSSNLCTNKEFSEEYNSPMFSFQDTEEDILVIGGSNVDRTYRVSEDLIQLDGSTHACSTYQCGGGVARNIAEALWRMRNGRVKLLTAVGDDADGQYLQNIAPGLLLEGCVMKESRTATYAAVMDPKGECRLGLGDMDLHKNITIDLVNRHLEVLKRAPLVILDGNPPQSTIDHVMQQCHRLQKPVFFEPTDRRKAIKVLQSSYTVTFASPNLSELRAMAYFVDPKKSIDKDDELMEVIELAKIVSQFIKILIVTLGDKGIVIVRNQHKNENEKSELVARQYHADVIENVENVSGAGDCLASGIIHGMLLGLKEPFSVTTGFEAAKLALLSRNTIPNNIQITDYEKIPKHTILL